MKTNQRKARRTDHTHSAQIFIVVRQFLAYIHCGKRSKLLLISEVTSYKDEECLFKKKNPTYTADMVPYIHKESTRNPPQNPPHVSGFSSLTKLGKIPREVTELPASQSVQGHLSSSDSICFSKRRVWLSFGLVDHVMNHERIYPNQLT